MIRKLGFQKKSMSSLRFKTMDASDRRRGLGMDSHSKLNFSTVKSIFGRCKMQETKVMRQNDIRKSDKKSSR